jgi:hypothetical protein
MKPGTDYGEITDRFELMELIGSGGVSSVYRARERSSGSEWAVKILHSHLSSDEAMRQRIRNEVELTTMLESPSIIKCREIIEDNENMALILELLPGGDLKSSIMDLGSIPSAEAMRIMEQLLDGLDAAHGQGIVHCDIKPQNILFAADGSIRISDFGFARSISLGESSTGDDGTAELALTGGAGTPDYAAPELLSGGLPDPRADIYSAGVVLFEMLTGSLPFTSSSPHLTIQRHMNDPVPAIRDFDPELSDDLQAIINTAMAKLPGDRFQTASEFSLAIRKGRVGRSLPPARSSSCPQCGAPLYRDFPLCLRCGYLEARLAPALPIGRAGESRARSALLITGPGEPGDRFPLDLRHRLVDFVSRIGGDTRRIEKRIPRLPFFLLRNLTEQNARELGASLSELGIESRVINPDNPEQRRFARRKIARKFGALYPRILLIMAGMSGGFVAQLNNAPQVMLPLIGAGVFLVLPTVTLIGFLRPEIRQNIEGSRIPTAALAKLASQLEQPQARSVIQRISLSLAQLEREKAKGSELEQLYGGFQEMIAQVQALDGELSRLRKGSPGPDELKVISQLESTLQRYLDRLLRHSVEVDRVRLAKISVGGEVQ